MEMQPCLVLIKVDEDNLIYSINSSAFVTDLNGWIKIDEGFGDKYHHAQGNYLDKSLYEERGIKRYKYVDGKVVERTQEEIDADYVPYVPPLDPRDIEIANLREQMAAMSASLLNL